MSHSRKILSQAGTALADIYDVEGSVVGLENLDVGDIKGVHDLGPTIHSERLNVFGLIADSGATAQNASFNVELGAFPDSVNRVLSVAVAVDTAARLGNCSVHVHDTATGGGDMPIWIWDSVLDGIANLRIVRPGIAVATLVALVPVSLVAGGLPTILARTGAASQMPSLFFRGATLGFGAGNVTARAFIQVARPDRGAPGAGEPSSHGLPIPSW